MANNSLITNLRKHHLICMLAVMISTLPIAAGSAYADNRFDQQGGAVDGEGSFGAGSVTVHHNLLAAERAELEAMIQQLRLDHEQELQLLSDQNEALEAVMLSEDERLDGLVANAQQEADSASAEAAEAHQRLDDLISDISPRLNAIEKDIVDNFAAAMGAANNAQATADASRAYAEYTRNNIASPGLSKANQAFTSATNARSRADYAHNRIDSLSGQVASLKAAGKGTIQTYETTGTCPSSTIPIVNIQGPNQMTHRRCMYKSIQ